MQCVDPRYRLVTKGIAPNVEDLGGKWAVPGFDSNKYSSFQQAFANNATYGQKIMNVVDKIMQMPVSLPVKSVEVQEEFMDDQFDNEVIQDGIEMPQQGNQLDTSTSGIIAAFIDLLVTFVSAWQAVDDEPQIAPSKKKRKSKKVKKNPKK